MEFEGLFSDFEVSETSSVSSSCKSDYEELVTREVQKISVVERALSSFNKVVSIDKNEKSSVPDEHSLFGAYVASECRSIKDKQVLLLLQKRIKDAIFKTKKSLSGSDSEKEVKTTGENCVNKVEAVTKRYTKHIVKHLYDNDEIRKNYENEESSDEDKEVSLMLNYGGNGDTANVKSSEINNAAHVNYERSEVYIKEEIIDDDSDGQEAEDAADNSNFSVARLSEDKKSNVYHKKRRQETTKKDIIICSPDFVVDQSYKVRSRNQHGSNKPVVNKERTNKYQLYKCPDCTKTFLTDTRFYAHIELHETGALKRSYECEECGKSFSDKGYFYNKHLKVHTGIKNHMCEICGKCFATRSHLKGHMLIHENIKNYKCSICGKLFTHNSQLIVHLRMHRNDKRFKCTICEKSFVANGNLQQHMLVHVNDKNYCCQECGKYFKHKNAFKMHLLWHSGVKEYVCDMCGKGYYTQGKLNVHMKMHKVGMFICLECGKDFKLKDLLRRHMVIHIGEKNFMCDECGKCFLHARNLKQHTKSHIHRQMNYQYLM